MSFALPSALFREPRSGRSSLAGILQEGLSQAQGGPTTRTTRTMVSFQALLVQQALGARDHLSLPLNSLESGQRVGFLEWQRLLALAQYLRQGAVIPPSPRPGIHLNATPAPGFCPSRTTPPTCLLQPTQTSLETHPAIPTAAKAVPAPEPCRVAQARLKAPTSGASAPNGFLEKLAGAAQVAAEALGLSPHLLLAQAALETGWGRKALQDAQGQDSHNLFGIKAGKSWTGRTVEVKTTEYANGVPQQKVESFRAYDSFAESFADYARLIKRRYGDVISNGATAEGFGQALQARGYATDPHYAQKIARIAQSVATRLASMQGGNVGLG